MKVWNKVKAILSQLLNWLRRRVKSVESTSKVKKVDEELARLVSTKRSGPNMPRRQSCPNGHGRKRRDHKTMGGAYYHCWCSDFFVRSPGA